MSSKKLKKAGGILKKVLGSVAPLVGTAIGGPFGGLATTVLREAFGSDDDRDIERQIASASPDALLKLRTAEQAMEAKMRELDIDEQALYIEDTRDARLMARETGTTPQLLLTALFLAIYAGLVAAFFTLDFELNDWQRGQMGILIGVVTSAVVQIINFWFGSSKGSKDKNLLMKESTS
jgi:hypothetical protein